MNTTYKILNAENAIQQAQIWKNNGFEVVFTNGCFDILHAGHIEVLEQARAKGDKLIVAVNTDESVKKLKGNNRPIHPETARCKVLAALACVDAVVLFNEETPEMLINAIIPDVLIKGGDYEVEKIVGYDCVIENGGKVETIALLQGFSTTNSIEKINNK